MGTLAEATSLTVRGPGFVAQLDPAWSGWGPAGGYLMAIALRAAEKAVPAGHRPVTMSCQFLSAGQNGEADVAVDVVKPGASACSNVVLAQGGRRFFQAQIWTTSRTRGPDDVTALMPIVPGPEDVEPIEAHLKNSKTERVAFWSNIDCRPIAFREPGGPAAREHRLQRWYRFKGSRAGDDVFLNAGCAALLIDANVWASHWRMRNAPPDYAGPTLDTTVWFHDCAGATGWVLVDADSDIARAGLVHGTVRVWSEGGRPIATGGSQCLVVPLPPKAGA